jgi:immune inhibitor A
MGAWEKLQLGWLDYRTVPFGQDMTVKLGPSGADEKTSYQAIAVPLPDKTVTTDYNTPHSGTSEWWGGSADGLNSTLTRTVDLTGKTSGSVSAWEQHNIEEGYDFLTGEVSADGGATWADAGAPIDGPSGNAGLSAWAQKTWDLTPFAGKSVQFRFRYATDGGVHFEGPFLDDITVTLDGAAVLTDDVESGDNGWTAAGFTRTSGSTSVVASHYYLAENRVYKGYDATLKTGPYNFGYGTTKPDWVERFPYQNGMLVT